MLWFITRKVFRLKSIHRREHVEQSMEKSKSDFQLASSQRIIDCLTFPVLISDNGVMPCRDIHLSIGFQEFTEAPSHRQIWVAMYLISLPSLLENQDNMVWSQTATQITYRIPIGKDIPKRHGISGFQKHLRKSREEIRSLFRQN